MKIKQHLLAILACLLWSSAFAVIKYALAYWQPLPLAGVRFFSAGLVLSPFILKEKKIKELFKIAIPLGFIQTALQYGAFTFGMNLVDGASGAIVVGIGPLAAAVLSHFYFHDDKMNKAKALTIGAGIFGVVILAIPKGFSANRDMFYLLGLLLLLISVLSSSFASILVAKKRDKNLNPFALNSLQFMLGGSFLILLTVLTNHNSFVLPHNTIFWAALGWLIFLSTGAFSLWYYLLADKDVKVSQLSFWKFIIPVFGALLSWVILPEEEPSLLSIVGILISGGAVLLYYLVPAKQK
ncbi:DMT family transporter [Spirochaeta cellobiosiphila]|uniref:DMT family transporter n=1 Tax=Spirochaeta cellobiosiphila TaxID=504483 RepID=UPI0004294889|nr:DMT family transporter [Spirochaeta cellobiosiphila]